MITWQYIKLYNYCTYSTMTVIYSDFITDFQYLEQCSNYIKSWKYYYFSNQYYKGPLFTTFNVDVFVFVSLALCFLLLWVTTWTFWERLELYTRPLGKVKRMPCSFKSSMSRGTFWALLLSMAFDQPVKCNQKTYDQIKSKQDFHEQNLFSI